MALLYEKPLLTYPSQSHIYAYQGSYLEIILTQYCLILRHDNY